MFSTLQLTGSARNFDWGQFVALETEILNETSAFGSSEFNCVRFGLGRFADRQLIGRQSVCNLKA